MVAQQGFPPAASPNARVAGAPADAPSACTNPPNGGGSSIIVGAASVGRVASSSVP